jgi:hypothetical protein
MDLERADRVDVSPLLLAAEGCQVGIDAFEKLQALSIGRARDEDGVTWDEVGTATGRSRSASHERSAGRLAEGHSVVLTSAAHSAVKGVQDELTE